MIVKRCIIVIYTKFFSNQFLYHFFFSFGGNGCAIARLEKQRRSDV